MKNHLTAAGAFVVSAVLLFSVGLFLIGDRHTAFTHHVDFWTALGDVNGVAVGTKIRVGGFDAGQVTKLQIPDKPSSGFLLTLHLDGKLRALIREDSVVTVETDGLVGDKFLLIHQGTDGSPEAQPGARLKSQEPIELSAVVTKLTGVMDQANATIGDLRGKLDGTLDTVTATVANANGMVSDVRHGKGTVGMLLNDPQTAGKVKETVANVQTASANLNRVSAQATQVMSDFQSRQLFAKAEDTLNNAKDASKQLDQTAQQVNGTLNEALGPDRSGENAGQNLRETLSNVNLATQNVADDTEALKHGFFFRGFFKKRGYYSLREMTPEQYRSNRILQDAKNERNWLEAGDAFEADSNGSERLTAAGAAQIDEAIGQKKDSIVDQPIVVEGYSTQPSAAEQMATSRSRALLVARYLEKRYHLMAKNVGVMALNDAAPATSGKSSWNGACIVVLAGSK